MSGILYIVSSTIPWAFPTVQSAVDQVPPNTPPTDNHYVLVDRPFVWEQVTVSDGRRLSIIATSAQRAAQGGHVGWIAHNVFPSPLFPSGGQQYALRVVSTASVYVEGFRFVVGDVDSSGMIISTPTPLERGRAIQVLFSELHLNECQDYRAPAPDGEDWGEANMLSAEGAGSAVLVENHQSLAGFEHCLVCAGGSMVVRYSFFSRALTSAGTWHENDHHVSAHGLALCGVIGCLIDRATDEEVNYRSDPDLGAPHGGPAPPLGLVVLNSFFFRPTYGVRTILDWADVLSGAQPWFVLANDIFWGYPADYETVHGVAPPFVQAVGFSSTPGGAPAPAVRAQYLAYNCLFRTPHTGIEVSNASHSDVDLFHDTFVWPLGESVFLSLTDDSTADVQVVNNIFQGPEIAQLAAVTGGALANAIGIRCSGAAWLHPYSVFLLANNLFDSHAPDRRISNGTESLWTQYPGNLDGQAALTMLGYPLGSLPPNFYPAPGSLAIDAAQAFAGVPVPALDAASNPRGALPDLGCLEAP